MQKVSEDFEKLYHYTNLDGLIGILQSKTLWATHFKFLNDYSEIFLFRDKLISLTLPLVESAYKELIKQSPDIEIKIKQEGGLSQVALHDAEVFVDSAYYAMGNEIYILSFCGQHENSNVNRNGLLSQWRGYGTGGGFALVFNTHKIEELLGIEMNEYEYDTIHLCDTIYSDNEKKLNEELSEDLPIIYSDIKKLFNHVTSDKTPDLKSYVQFVRCISRYKHYGFSEENEVRAVFVPTIIDQELLEIASRDGSILKPEKERKFRNKNGQIAAYIEIFNSKNTELPIERIIVGPHKEKEARAASLRVMLKNTKIEITCSEIPFVG